MYDLDQVRLVRHHLVDVLVGAWNFIDHSLVFPADDPLRLRLKIGNRKGLLRGVAAHPASGAVGAGMEALRRALAAHDVAARAHAAGDDAELAGAGADRALAREPDLLPEVLLALDVVVMTVDRLTGDLEAGQVPMQRVEHEVHHLLAVDARVVL